MEKPKKNTHTQNYIIYGGVSITEAHYVYKWVFNYCKNNLVMLKELKFAEVGAM